MSQSADATVKHIEGRDHSFAVLDGLRGVAAIAVMFYHYSGEISSYTVQWLPNGYLAVDFFFVLSGFIVAHAYDRRLLQGYTIGSFMLRRLIRLYPIYWLGMSIPLVAGMVIYGIKGTDDPQFLIFPSYLLSLFFVPSPHVLAGTHTEMFPLNGPAWSLSLEITINFIYGLLCRYLNLYRLGWLVGIAFVVLAATVVDYKNMNLGWDYPSYEAGWPRVLWSFSAGILLRRLFNLETINRFAAWVSLMLVAFLTAGLSLQHQGLANWLPSVFLLLPLIVWTGAQTCVWLPARALCAWLGRISYALYILQFPLLSLFGITAKFFKINLGDHVTTSVLLCSLGALLLVSLIDVIYDVPVRAFLTKKLIPPSLRPASLRSAPPDAA